MLLFLFMRLMSAQTILAPVEDVYIVTFGGGEGCNVFLKYDISSVPNGLTIDSVAIVPFVRHVNPNWDGDANFWNVNNQTWTEIDSARFIWDSPTSDSTHQAFDFGTSPGYTQSVDLRNIFITDYNPGHTYCSIKIKDPDDITNVPIPGSYPFDYDDTLVLGNRTNAQHIIFYPHEFTNAPPWLVLAYHAVGTEEEDIGFTRPLLHIYPNPCQNATTISFSRGCNAESRTLKIYDSTGKLIRVFNQKSEIRNLTSVLWDATDDSGCRAPAGVYFCELQATEHSLLKKICLVR